jgi:dUTP pyrophosphatase
MVVKIVNKSTHPLPHYQTQYSAGMDIRAFLKKDIQLAPMQRILVPTGLYIEIPRGYEAQVRPRSGLAISHGITVLNAPGTVDSDYRGELKVILVNLSENNFVIRDGERIAQLIFSEHETVTWEKVDILNSTERNEGGFGSTGK